MISGINLATVTNYSCKADKKNPTIWKLGPLSSRALSKISDKTSLGKPTDRLIEVAKLGIKGWENFKITGKDIIFSGDENGLSDTILDIIPLNTLVELGTEILKFQKLSDNEIKN